MPPRLTFPSSGVPTISNATSLLLAGRETPDIQAFRARRYSPAASTPHSAHCRKQQYAKGKKRGKYTVAGVAYSFSACGGRLTFVHASLSRRSSGGAGGTTTNVFNFHCPRPIRCSWLQGCSAVLFLKTNFLFYAVVRITSRLPTEAYLRRKIRPKNQVSSGAITATSSSSVFSAPLVQHGLVNYIKAQP